MKNSKLKFSEYMQNISRSKSFGKFVLIVAAMGPSSYGSPNLVQDLEMWEFF